MKCDAGYKTTREIDFVHMQHVENEKGGVPVLQLPDGKGEEEGR